MVVLRRTEKLARHLGALTDDGTASDTALGDWYVNRLVVDRQPLLLLISERSLLPILVPARDTKGLPARLPDLVARRLRRMGIPEQHIATEVRAMSPVRVGKTANRSVVGILVDFALNTPYYLEHGAWDETTLPFVEMKLQGTPCHVSRSDNRTVFPDRATPALLAARWDAS